MQLKYLNFHKFLANISTNLIGAFIPLIILQATGSLVLALLFFMAQYAIRMIFNFAFKKLYYKYPQIILLWRILPIFLYCVFIIIINYSMWVGVIGTVIFYAMSDSMNSLPREVILNYSSLNGETSSSSTLGLTRFIEQAGAILALIVGGYLMDINQTIVIIISLSIYAISVIPLVMYYVKSKNEKTFNQDATSNAYMSMVKNKKRRDEGSAVSKKILISYGLVYFLYGLIDAFSAIFNLYLFKSGGTFALAGVYSALFNGAYGVGSFVYGKVNDKMDTTILVCISCVVCGVGCVVIPFIHNSWVLYTLFVIIGFEYSSLSVYMFNRLITKSRILGVSNEALFVRENYSMVSLIVASAFGLFGPLIPCFVAIGTAMASSSVAIPYGEEKTRKLLVNYLQYNELQNKPQIKNEKISN